MLFQKNLGLNLDTAYFPIMGIDPPIIVRRYGDRIYRVHVKDIEMVPENRREYGFAGSGRFRAWRFRTLGYGDINWGRFITSLIEADYQGVVATEHLSEIDDFDWSIKHENKFLNTMVHTNE